MKLLVYSITLLSFLCSNILSSQVSVDVAQITREMENILLRHDSCHYRTEMLFKEFGGDTFQSRMFLINYKTNINNLLYGYDFEISELLTDSTIFTIMDLNHSRYVIYSGTKRMAERKLPEKIERGSLFETLRNYFIWSEVFLPFINVEPDKITLIDSNGLYYLTISDGILSTRTLALDKITFLPRKSESVLRNNELDLEQVLEINFFYNKTVFNLPKNAFSPENYIAQGYTHTRKELDSKSENLNIDSFSLDDQKMLLNYPFITSTGDTTLIKDYSADYIVLDFWFASCFPCQQALPELNRIADLYSDFGLEIIGLNCFDKDIRLNLESKIRSKGITIPFLFGSKDLINSLQIRSFPSYYLVSPAREIKLIEGGVEEVKKVIEQIFNKN